MDEPKTCSYEGCRESPWAEDPKGLCLCHSPENGRDAETSRTVWDRARAKAREGSADFRGWHFPADGEAKGFADTPFQGTSRFDDASFEGDVRFEHAEFQGAALFKGVSFAGTAWFEGVSFQGFAWFDHPSFQGNAWFNKASFRGHARFGGASFQGSAKFSDACFEAGAEFAGVHFLGDTWFDNAQFRGDARFVGARFDGGLTVFAGARFAGSAWLTDASFRRTASFKGAGFQGDARFHGAAFQGEVNFRGVDWAVGKEIDFDLPVRLVSLQKRTPFRLPEQGEDAYRLAKQSATARGDYADAGEYHYAERCSMEHRLRTTCGWRIWRPGFWRSLFELIFARGVFGYGERPSRALLLGLAVIALWALLAYGAGGITPSIGSAPDYEPAPMQCFHFSVVTFTTVGYGDFVPKPHFRVWADAEAILGVSLMAVFIVGLTRKYMR